MLEVLQRLDIEVITAVSEADTVMAAYCNEHNCYGVMVKRNKNICYLVLLSLFCSVSVVFYAFVFDSL